MTAHTPPESAGQLLTFGLADQVYAVSVLSVREIIEYAPVTRLPGTPSHVRGAINLRGTVVPVVDLAVRFGLAVSEVTRRTCIVIVELSVQGERLPMGLVADSVNEVVELPSGTLEPAPAFGSRVSRDVVVGMAMVADRLVPVLDIDSLLGKEPSLGSMTAQAAAVSPLATEPASAPRE